MDCVFSLGFAVLGRLGVGKGVFVMLLIFGYGVVRVVCVVGDVLRVGEGVFRHLEGGVAERLLCDAGQGFQGG